MRSTGTAAVALGLLPLVFAHGAHEGSPDDMNMNMNMSHGAGEPKADPQSYPPTYFAVADYAGVIYAHIAVMVLAWVFVLPVAVMLSISRSRYTIAVQLVFLAVNALGAVLGAVYNANTPDLYPGNAHHQLGWLVTWVVSAQVMISLLGRVVGGLNGGSRDKHVETEYRSFIPVSTAAMAEHHRVNESPYDREYRPSDDSGHGTEPRTSSLRSFSRSSSSAEISPRNSDAGRKEYLVDDDDDDYEDSLPMPLRSEAESSKTTLVLAKIARKIPSRVWSVMLFIYNCVDRMILPLGFVVLCLGIVTYGRLFEGNGIYSGLAHWIKGGVFFWLGLLTLGRWTGSFGELGWAWNVRPKRTDGKWRPSAEFVESALIFVYGSTNVFLEHLGNWGGEYSAQDLEHISITVLFIGGGLFGMLVESSCIRDLLNTSVIDAAAVEETYDDEKQETLQPPRQYEIPINPIPALVILLLGIMMSSHTQHSMISSMVHKQWGNLLTGASFARFVTYAMMYLKPPKSVLPSRPPSELLAAFGLISGGIIFMASASDTVEGMIHYGLDAMFMYTVTMGLVGVLMAWEVLVLAIKGWAVRREAGRQPRRLS